MYCTACGAFNADDAHFCFACGEDIQPQTSATTSFSDEQLWRLYLGEKNQHYYVERFSQFASGGSKFSWHTVSFFFTMPWMLYRKMWQAAILYTLLGVVLQIMQNMTAKGSIASLLVSILTLVILLGVVPTLSNYWYFKKVSKVCAEVQAVPNVENPQIAHLLKQRGGTSRWWWAILAFQILIILLAIALPAYHAYQQKVHQHAFDDALRYSYEVKQSINRYYAEHGSTPDTLSDIGLDPNRVPAGVKNVMWQSDRNKLLVWVPSQQGERWFEFEAKQSPSRLDWQCQAMNFSREMIPSGCRP